jgi:hypothetical protein
MNKVTQKQKARRGRKVRTFAHYDTMRVVCLIESTGVIRIGPQPYNPGAERRIITEYSPSAVEMQDFREALGHHSAIILDNRVEEISYELTNLLGVARDEEEPATYDMTGSEASSAWLREHGIDPKRATVPQCADALNATQELGPGTVALIDDRLLFTPTPQVPTNCKIEIVGGSAVDDLGLFWRSAEISQSTNELPPGACQECGGEGQVYAWTGEERSEGSICYECGGTGLASTHDEGAH